MFVFTSCTNNYIPKARVLASTLKQWHPDWTFCLLLGETPPADFVLDEEPFDRVVQFHELPIPKYHSWLFRHRVVEICTAAKGPALHYFLETEQHDKVLYLDPDIMVCNDLSPLERLLDTHDILLTPHLLAPQPTDESVQDNEICTLQHGVFNLGFVGAARRDQGLAFAAWWRDRLLDYCYDDIPRGLFTDQRWCDLAPAFFSNLHIIRDPGYNAASWNLTDRTITLHDDVFMTNDVPLRFYHFTGFDSGAGEYMTAKYAKSMPAVGALWSLYKQRLMGFNHAVLGKQRWVFMTFEDGTPITDAMRLVYRAEPSLQTRFPNPFVAGYYEWYQQEMLPQQTGTQEAAPSIMPAPHKTSLAATLQWHMAKHGGFPKAIPHLLKKVCHKIRQYGFRTVTRAVWHGVSLNSAQSLQSSSGKQHNDSEDVPPHLAEQLTQPTTRSLLEQLLAPSHHPVCIFEHDWGGGADAYAQQRIARYLKENRAVVRIRYSIPQQRLEMTVCHNELAQQYLLQDIQELADPRFPRLEELVVNELAGWYFNACSHNPYMLDAVQRTVHDIVHLKKMHQARLEFIVHDFFAVCPSITLVNGKTNVFCGITSIEQCQDGSQCLGQGCIRSDFSMPQWRKTWATLLDHAETILFFSESTHTLVKAVYSLRQEQVHIQPHDVTLFNTSLVLPSESPMRIAVVGHIHPHKGSTIVVDLGNLLKEKAPEASIVIFGDIHTDIPTLPDNITVLGSYQHSELPALLEREKVTVGLMPSVCPETFSFVTHELASLGLPMVCFNLGAPADFIAQLEDGRVAPEMTAESAFAALQELDARRQHRTVSSQHACSLGEH